MEIPVTPAQAGGGSLFSTPPQTEKLSTIFHRGEHPFLSLNRNVYKNYGHCSRAGSPKSL
ncbi:hypothetical protein OHD62_08985 [Mesorhizobium sp. YC-39]|uniref:hypothetical protein n=1 Tax=unclassified Mesorhizobium TaxID=325217 RepID=UPI0021E906F5|nr:MULTISPECIES: hypothetical protein [unclassified Mesorhizobium]MCV3205100.1 hypothetical protein [Mesorhizobium sp. YC-2]MCV3228501.1 hypothetical protein [Mesorhizobium sp. YC-39]